MAGFNIAEFSTKINERGTIQNNKFLVKITLPTIFINNAISVQDTLTFRASSVKIPGINFNYLNSYRYAVGPEHKTPSNVSFNDISISFIEDKENSIWKFFNLWINQIFNFKPGNLGLKYTSNYKSNYVAPSFEIQIYNNDGKNPVNIIKLVQAYPSSLGDIGLSWNEKNNLMMINVGFAFTEWYFEGSDYSVEVQNNSTPGLTTNRIVPTSEPAAPEYSSATNRSFGNGSENPRIIQDVQIENNAPTDLQNNRAGGPFRSDQSVTGNEQQVVPGPLTWFRNLFR